MTRDHTPTADPLDDGDDLLWQLARPSALPLYLQIRQRLLTVIARWRGGDTPFYSETDLCERFGVSRMTVRQALTELVEDGFLTRRQGRGTFVVNARLDETFTPTMNVDKDWTDRGRPPQISVLSYLPNRPRAEAPAAVGAALAWRGAAADSADGLLFIRRVRSFGHVPVAIDERYVVADVAAAAKLTKKAAAGSIIERLRGGAELAFSDWRIEAALADAGQRELLLLDAGAPVLIRTMTYYDADDRPILSGRTVHRADLVRYRLRLPLTRTASSCAIKVQTETG